MKKTFFIFISFLVIFSSGCASNNGVRLIESSGIACSQTEEQLNEGKATCLKVRTDADPVKWHRVKAYEELPDIPDLP